MKKPRKKSPRQHADGLLRKAANDLIAAHATWSTGLALDTVCFHAQQAVEKSLKAILAFYDIPYPRSHNLAVLLKQAVAYFSLLKRYQAAIEQMTPFAVEIRYDEDFNPSKITARKTLHAADRIHGLVASSLKNRRKPAALEKIKGKS